LTIYYLRAGKAEIFDLPSRNQNGSPRRAAQKRTRAYFAVAKANATEKRQCDDGQNTASRF